MDYQHQGYENETVIPFELEEQEQQATNTNTTTNAIATTSSVTKTTTTTRHFNDKENAALQEELKQRFANKITLKSIKEEKKDMKIQHKQQQPEEDKNNKMDNKGKQQQQKQ